MFRSKKITRRHGLAREKAIAGYICALPWIIGFLIFILYPTIASLYYSLTYYDGINPPTWIGLSNYRKMFTDESYYFNKSLSNTIFMLIFDVPICLAVGLILAVILNQKVKGLSFYRTALYIPCIVPLVANSMLWMWILDSRNGILNGILRIFGIEGPAWLGSPAWSKPALILMDAWQTGSIMLIFLAGLQGIPQQYYEAAEIDGAGSFYKFTRITLPLLTPTIFFNLIIGCINVMQIFVRAYIMTNGGPQDSTLFYVLYLYRNAFSYFQMGYASSLAWILFLITLTLTLIQVFLSRRWVHYEIV